MENKNYVYVVFSKTSTKIGKMIRTVTRNEYNHTSLSFDKNLGVMYSFARYKYHYPMAGGFVVEYPVRYIHGGNDAKVKICRISLSDESYGKLKKRIQKFISTSDDSCYNTFNLLLYPLHLQLNLTNSYTCVEFVAKILGVQGIRSIRDFEERLSDNVIYEGRMSNIVKYGIGTDEEYFGRQSFRTACSQSYVQFKKLCKKVRTAK